MHSYFQEYLRLTLIVQGSTLKIGDLKRFKGGGGLVKEVEGRFMVATLLLWHKTDNSKVRCLNGHPLYSPFILVKKKVTFTVPN